MIRVATINDIPAIIECGDRLMRAGEFHFTGINFQAAVDRLVHAIRSPVEWMGVAEHKGKIVGFLILVAQPMWWQPKLWQVVDDIIYCERPGMGRALLHAGLKWAWSVSGVAEVILSLNSGLSTDRAASALCKHGLRTRGITLSIARPTTEAKRWAA